RGGVYRHRRKRARPNACGTDPHGGGGPTPARRACAQPVTHLLATDWPIMSLTLIHHADLLVTMDPQRREIRDGSVVVDDRAIIWVGAAGDLPPDYQERAQATINARGRVVLPGFVNTHHHFFQTLTRAVPQAQNAVLFDWLKTLYPIWAELTPDAVRISTQLALVELLLSGCTTSSDHHYLWPNGSRLDDQ